VTFDFRALWGGIGLQLPWPQVPRWPVPYLALMALLQDLVQERQDLLVALLVGLICVTVPFGYGVPLVVGTVIARLPQARVLSPAATKTQ